MRPARQLLIIVNLDAIPLRVENNRASLGHTGGIAFYGEILLGVSLHGNRRASFVYKTHVKSIFDDGLLWKLVRYQLFLRFFRHVLYWTGQRVTYFREIVRIKRFLWNGVRRWSFFNLSLVSINRRFERLRP